MALRAFAAEPLRGVGAGGWAVDWIRWRRVREFAKDAHSLPLQTLAELGVVGTVLLVALLGGVGLAAARASRRARELAAGLVAAWITWLVHQPLDWDWEMPAVSLTAFLLAGAILRLGDTSGALGPDRSP